MGTGEGGRALAAVLVRWRGLGLPGFNAQALEQGQRPRQEIREVVHTGAPPEIAMRLDIDEGAEVVVRRLTFMLEGVPVALHDSYFPADLAAGTALEQPHLIRGALTPSSRTRSGGTSHVQSTR
jgi:GntR family transcriptional regulator